MGYSNIIMADGSVVCVCVGGEGVRRPVFNGSATLIICYYTHYLNETGTITKLKHHFLADDILIIK